MGMMPPADALATIPTSVDGSLPHIGLPLDPPHVHENVPPATAAAAATCVCTFLLWAGGSGDGSSNTGLYIGEGLHPVP